MLYYHHSTAIICKNSGYVISPSPSPSTSRSICSITCQCSSSRCSPTCVSTCFISSIETVPLPSLSKTLKPSCTSVLGSVVAFCTFIIIWQNSLKHTSPLWSLSTSAIISCTASSVVSWPARLMARCSSATVTVPSPSRSNDVNASLKREISKSVRPNSAPRDMERSSTVPSGAACSVLGTSAAGAFSGASIGQCSVESLWRY
mmetsp:Transcript_27993/g.47413  ORF Transcript_27993/g.47413 Transcript_27993/m.47413 type:complete len:203 (+) Transcript_27993:1175-1783(+)